MFLQNWSRKWGKETSSRPLFIFQKSFILNKCKWKFPTLTYNKRKLCEASDCWSRDMLNSDFFLKKKEVSCTIYPRKIFLMLYPINWPNFIAWLPLPLEISGNMCIIIVFSSLGSHRFWDLPYFCYQSIFTHDWKMCCLQTQFMFVNTEL